MSTRDTVKRPRFLSDLRPFLQGASKLKDLFPEARSLAAYQVAATVRWVRPVLAPGLLAASGAGRRKRGEISARVVTTSHVESGWEHLFDFTRPFFGPSRSAETGCPSGNRAYVARADLLSRTRPSTSIEVRLAEGGACDALRDEKSRRGESPRRLVKTQIYGELASS